MEEKVKNIIELKNICKVYDDDGFKAVDDFNLEVKRGEFVTFLENCCVFWEHPAVEKRQHSG